MVNPVPDRSADPQRKPRHAKAAPEKQARMAHTYTPGKHAEQFSTRRELREAEGHKRHNQSEKNMAETIGSKRHPYIVPDGTGKHRGSYMPKYW